MICFNNIPGIILSKINSDEMSQNSLCKKDINLLTVFKAQEFAIILLLQLKALKWESFLLIRVHQMSPFQKSKHLLILLTLRQKCMLLYLWWWLVCWKCYKNIRAIYNKLTVNIDSDIFIYTLFTAITSVCMCKIFLIYINYIIVNFRKKLYSCQAITHFFTNYQILAPPTPCPLPPPLKKTNENLHISKFYTSYWYSHYCKTPKKTPFCIFAYSL